jgi:hypothetical protein
MSIFDNQIEHIAQYVFIDFEQSGILFNEQQQSMVLLNQNAAMIWCLAFEVNSMNELVDYLVQQYHVSKQKIRQDVDTFLTDFKLNTVHLLKEMDYDSYLTPLENQIVFDDYSDQQRPSKQLLLSFNGLLIELIIESNDVLYTELSTIYQYLLVSDDKLDSVTSEPIKKTSLYIRTNLISMDNKEQVSDARCYLFINKVLIADNLTNAQLIPYIFGTIFQLSYDEIKLSDKLMFHAAVLCQKENQANLFLAESGAGKSTLAAILIKQGWSFFSDELAVVNIDNRTVEAHPMPICIKEGAVEVLSEKYFFLKKQLVYQRMDEKKVRYLPIIPLIFSHKKMMINTAHIEKLIFPQYMPGVTTRYQKINKMEALKRLMLCGSSGRALRYNDIISVLMLLKNTPCQRLEYSNFLR